MSGAPASSRTLPRPLRVSGIVLAAVLLTSLFVYLGFPYDRLANLVAGRVEQETGLSIAFSSVEASPGLLGPGIAIHDLRATAPDGQTWQASRVRVRPAWSTSWLMARPAIFVDAQSPLGRLRGVTTIASEPTFDGEISGLDLGALLEGRLPGAKVSGSADLVGDLTFGPQGPQGPVSLEAKGGVLSHPSLPVDVPFEQIEGQIVLGGRHTAEITSLEIDSPLGTGRITGTIGRGRALQRAPLDLTLDVSAAENIRKALTAQGVRFGQDGKLKVQIKGTLARPATLRR